MLKLTAEHTGFEPPPDWQFRPQYPITGHPSPWYFRSYLHGDAERLAGHDIPIFLDGHLPYAFRETRCLIHIPDKVIHGIMVQWIMDKRYLVPINENSWEIHERPQPGSIVQFHSRALIVANGDGRSLEYARLCAKERRSFI